MADVPKLPRGAVKAAVAALYAAGEDETGAWDGVARIVLEAARPAIERQALRDAARRILELDAAEREKRRQPGCRNVGPWNSADSVLRRLARGEPLPELPRPDQQGDQGNA